MVSDSLNYELLMKARDISCEIEEFTDLSNDVDNVGDEINAVLDYLGKAKEILDNYLNEEALDEIISESDLYPCPMYGPPEILFDKKDRAEEALKNELLAEVNDKKLLATQWKEIVKQIIETIPEGRETIKRIIDE